MTTKVRNRVRTSDARPARLPDHANEADTRAVPIQKVGIKDLSYPVAVLDRTSKLQHTIARISMYVSLPHNFKGTHMSRFIEVLNTVRGEMTIRNLPDILAQVQSRLEAEDAHIEVSFPYFLTKFAPVSRAESLMEYQCKFSASRHGSSDDFVIGVRVPVKSLCPCSKSISKYGAHNQRSYVDVELRCNSFVWIEDIVAAVEACASAPLYALLKREDEKYITEIAYENPKFVEDLVRDVLLKLRDFPGVTWLRVGAENQESIHNHSAYAELEWPERVVPSDAPTSDTSPSTPDGIQSPTAVPHFGAWLRAFREGRRISQRELAQRLGISGPFISRIESGAKSPPVTFLDKLATAYGLDRTRLYLQGGHCTPEVSSKIAGNLRSFEAWLSRQ
jgi:GTP cyclohydrolase I